MEREIQNLISLLKQTFEKGAWHGPSVMEALEGVDEAQATRTIPSFTASFSTIFIMLIKKATRIQTI